MARGSITAQLDSGYLKNLTAVVTHITGKGKFAVLDAHNYGRYNGAVITDTAAFGTFWKNLATQFKSNANVVSRSLALGSQINPSSDRMTSPDFRYQQ